MLQTKPQIQRRANGDAGGRSTAPLIVNDVLRSPGQSLNPTTRGFMETRFGHDFSQVRVHTDTRAAESARAVSARAYTVGRDIAFGSGQYAPDTSTGQRLLAHELTHTIQQAETAPALQRDGFSPSLNLVPELEFDPPTPPPLLWPGQLRETYVIPMPAPPQIDLPEPTLTMPSRTTSPLVNPELDFQPPQFTPVALVTVPRCIPARALTWADFQGTPPANSHHGAFTSAGVDPRDVQGNTMFQATLNNSASWVKPSYANASNTAQNGCSNFVSQCETFFSGLGPNQTGTWTRGNGSCPATILNTPPAVATNNGECTTEIGAECNANAPAESARLLAHEQGHWDITCKLTHKANDALAAGSSLQDVNQALTQKLQPTHDLYDSETNHGCNAAQQSTWNTQIANNLPNVTIP